MQRSHIGSVVAAALELVVQLMTVPSGWVTDVVVDDMVGCGFPGRGVLSGGRGRAGRESGAPSTSSRRAELVATNQPRLFHYSAMTMEYYIMDILEHFVSSHTGSRLHKYSRILYYIS